MGVPATTGKLCTNLREMNVGDYIKFGWNGTTFYFGGDTELPVTPGTSWNTGQFVYLVKTAKGICIADRVAYTGSNWNAINNMARIENAPFDTGNALPIMTSNVAPSGVASASSALTGYDAFRAFNRNTAADTARWVSEIGVTSAWLKYDFGSGNEKAIQKYTIVAGFYPSASPKNWTFEGSNTGIFAGEQVVLDQQANQISWSSTKRTFTFANKEKYRYYRINITANNGYTGYFTYIEELEMIEEHGIVRSPSGGVVYADANGQPTFTYQGKGAWPTNNEWDRLVLGFPASKIKAGSTLNDVFHYEEAYSFVQETPLSGTWKDNAGTASTSAGVSMKMLRGKNSRSTWADLNYVSATTADSTYGYRPVLEYKEA